MTASARVLGHPTTGARLCAICGQPPTWQVGPDDRACDDHLGHVLAHYYAHDYDGFSPCVVLPVSRRGGAT